MRFGDHKWSGNGVWGLLKPFKSQFRVQKHLRTIFGFFEKIDFLNSKNEIFQFFCINKIEIWPNIGHLTLEITLKWLNLFQKKILTIPRRNYLPMALFAKSRFLLKNASKSFSKKLGSFSNQNGMWKFFSKSLCFPLQLHNLSFSHISHQKKVISVFRKIEGVYLTFVWDFHVKTCFLDVFVFTKLKSMEFDTFCFKTIKNMLYQVFFVFFLIKNILF